MKNLELQKNHDHNNQKQNNNLEEINKEIKDFNQILRETLFSVDEMSNNIIENIYKKYQYAPIVYCDNIIDPRYSMEVQEEVNKLIEKYYEETGNKLQALKKLVIYLAKILVYERSSNRKKEYFEREFEYSAEKDVVYSPIDGELKKSIKLYEERLIFLTKLIFSLYSGGGGSIVDEDFSRYEYRYYQRFLEKRKTKNSLYKEYQYKIIDKDGEKFYPISYIARIMEMELDIVYMLANKNQLDPFTFKIDKYKQFQALDKEQFIYLLKKYGKDTIKKKGKKYFTIFQAKAILGKRQEEIIDLISDSKLRAFRHINCNEKMIVLFLADDLLNFNL